MATVTIEGRKVTVSDDFLKLSPQEQADEVDEIAERIGIRPPGEVQPSAPGGQFGPRSEPQEQEAPFTWAGLGAQSAAGVGKGAVGAPGLAFDAIEGVNDAGGRFVNWIDGAPEGQGVKFSLPPMPFFGSDIPKSSYLVEKANEALRPAPTTAQIISGEQPQSFLMRQPENTAEQYGDTVGQFVGGSWIGPGSWGMKALSGATGGLASETAGQAFEGSPFEGTARLAAGFAGAITPHAVAGARGSHVPRQMVTRAMEGVDEAILNRADFLRQVAARQGIDLSWPEALEQASKGATRLPDLQRVVENSEHGGPTMRRYYANRPQQIDAAARDQFDAIAPQPMIPERLGPRVQAAAEGDIRGVGAGINRQTRPLYNAAEQQQLPPNSPVLQDPAYIRAVQEIRNNPVIAPHVAHLADNSVGMVDLAQRMMRDRAQSLRTDPRNLNTYEASLTSEARRAVSNEARNLSPEYDAARQLQAQSRDLYLNPLEEGPAGKLAGTTDVQAQTRALFPSQPTAQSEVGVARAMRGIRQTDPEAAEGLVRQHLENVFNEATQRTQAGANPYGGAKFSAVVAGNSQQRTNLIAALRQLPNGSTLWKGFSRFIDILEATGKRSLPNSATQFNAQTIKELERGGYGGELATIAGSPQKALTFIKDGYARLRLGKNTAQLARLFTEGNVDDFRALLNAGPVGPRALVAMVRLLAQVGAGTQSAPSSEPVQ